MAVIILQKKNHPGARPLFWFYTALFIWSFAYIFESAALLVPEKLFWSQVAYIGTVSIPLLLLAFTQEFGNRFILTKPIHWILGSLIPIITLLLSWTNNSHNWIWTNIQIESSNHLAVYSHGIWFWVFFIYAYTIILVSLYQLLGLAFRLRKIYRNQAILSILAAVSVVVGNILYIIPSNPIPGMEWTLVGFIFTSIFLALGIFRFKLFDLIPVARGALVEIMSEGVLLIDNKGRIQDVNPSFLKLINADISGKYLGSQIETTFANAPSIITILNRPELSADSIRTEINIGKKVLDVSVTDLKEHSKTVSGRLMVINDISSLKLTENALHESNKVLSKEVKKGQKLIDELDAYAHTVAHDLKTPLNGIVGFSELLAEELREGNTEQTLKLSELIHESAYKMGHIIEELLLLASVRSQEVERHPIDMATVFSTAYERINALIIESGAIIYPPELWPEAIGYGPWVEEIWVNYLTNAIKYGGDPAVIRIYTKTEQNMIWFSICDNGSGIPEELMDRLFIPHSRLNPKKAEGHGLGLSIVKRIIDTLGGKVKVENNPNSGAIFSFGLPTDIIEE
ncbi:MAG: PAS domain-containing protein [Bacteroidales bacterium]|nr:PAS domain-containing protein [Bacteroidales bacterium]